MQKGNPEAMGILHNSINSLSILKNNQPSLLCEPIKGNLTANGRRPAQPKFYDTSRKKIGSQSVKNKISEVFKSINLSTLNGAVRSFRRQLKETFFPYFESKAERPVFY